MNEKHVALDVPRFHLKDSIYKDHMETYLWYLTLIRACMCWVAKGATETPAKGKENTK